MKAEHQNRLAGGSIGFIIGFLILHPFSMMFQGLIYPEYSVDLGMLATAFQPSHLAMAFFFGAMGAFTGALFLFLVQSLNREKERVKLLEGLLAICSYCHRIKDNDEDRHDKTKWVELEMYIETHSATRFTHGICPDCYIEFMRKIELKQAAENLTRLPDK